MLLTRDVHTVIAKSLTLARGHNIAVLPPLLLVPESSPAGIFKGESIVGDEMPDMALS